MTGLVGGVGGRRGARAPRLGPLKSDPGLHYYLFQRGTFGECWCEVFIGRTPFVSLNHYQQHIVF